MSRWFDEPLLHFVLLGAACFALYAWAGPAVDRALSSRHIALGVDELLQLEASFEAQWRRPPTEAELAQLVESRVQEEILYREALALGLDDDDTIVRRRMAQKMQFLAEDVGAAREPSADELHAWFARHERDLAVPARLTFRQRYFSPDRRGGRARDDAAAALGGDVESAGDPSMLPQYFADRTVEQLAKDFGPRFAEAVGALAPGAWRGPIESGFGWHLVFVDSVVAGRVPAFEEVEAEVRSAWLAEQKATAWSTAYAAMRAKYTVLLPVPAADAPSRLAASDVGE